jgi:predicted transposase/invertase (TIGR01784 family)
VIAINIVNYEFMPRVPDFHLSFHIWEDTHREALLTDALEIHFIDMVKFRRLSDKDLRHDALHRWLAWLDKDSPEKLIEEAITMDGAIQKAEERMAYVAQDKEALRAYQMREMALSDLVSGLNHARREGLQEGIEQGRKEAEAKYQREVEELKRKLREAGIDS